MLDDNFMFLVEKLIHLKTEKNICIVHIGQKPRDPMKEYLPGERFWKFSFTF